MDMKRWKEQTLIKWVLKSYHWVKMKNCIKGMLACRSPCMIKVYGYVASRTNEH